VYLGVRVHGRFDVRHDASWQLVVRAGRPGSTP
jgi:hypothetical protein